MRVPRLLRGLRREWFACIAADVPWKFVVRSHKGHKRSPEKHYKTMTLEEIAALPVARHAAKDAFLMFWITGPHFAKGNHAPIMRAWGFEPVAVWGVWIKPSKKRFRQGLMFFDDHQFFLGMGYTTRQNAEFVVLGRRGNPKRLSKSVRQIMASPLRQHSRKPDEFFARAEQFCVGPRLELFGREQRKGWIVRGNEAHKFKAGEKDARQDIRLSGDSGKDQKVRRSAPRHARPEMQHGDDPAGLAI